jgi:hypothetical protein
VSGVVAADCSEVAERDVWSLSVYPQAREAGGAFIPLRPPSRAVRFRVNEDPAAVAARAERSAAEASRRAKGRLRRYCAANRLNRLGTLTYAGSGCHDPRQIRADVGRFFRELRTATGGHRFPYVWVPEWHKTDHGMHLHFAVGRFIRRRMIESAWGHGFVHIKLLGDLPVGSGTLAEARRAAGYLSKYVTKAFSDNDRPAGLHRFDVAQGFQPERLRLVGRSSDGLIRQASEMFGGPPVLRWSSRDVPEWQGAPAIWAQWA